MSLLLQRNDTPMEHATDRKSHLYSTRFTLWGAQGEATAEEKELARNLTIFLLPTFGWILIYYQYTFFKMDNLLFR